MKPDWKLRFLPLALVAAAAAGCGDGGTDPGDVLGDFDGNAIHTTIEALTAPVDASAEATGQLYEILFQLSADQSMEPVRMADRIGTSPVVGGMALKVFAEQLTFRPIVAFPQEMVGQTLVYDEAEGGWVVDESRDGAPADGVRAIWYSTDSNGSVQIPLDEQGYIDLTDEDSGGTSGLGVRIVRTAGGEVVLADYTQRVRRVEADYWVEEYEVDGFFSDGTDRSDVTLMAFDSIGAGGEEEYEFALSLEGDAGSYQWESVGSYESNGDGQDDIDITVTPHSGVSTVLALQSQQTGNVVDGDGTLSHSGVVIANVSLDENDELVLTPAGGGTFSQQQQFELEGVVVQMLLAGFIMLFTLLPIGF